ncbi:hypothetical protein [Streptomyces prunicolor]|uniref:hypothetical protein n=1 Tax=Streptomyces prunicolor TaxID=67348 RepID=UPI000371E327|nr:hypothetical protein [Streptomyces prunicolor]
MSRRIRTRRDRRDAERDARRESLFILLARAQRGALTGAEASLLRAHVEAEVDASDRFRAEAGGQQAAVRREQRRTLAAEDAIRETEQRAADAEEQLAEQDQAHRANLARRSRTVTLWQGDARADGRAGQQVAAVRALLPARPRPHLGLPNDLAYTNGQYDVYDAVRDALDQQ